MKAQLADGRVLEFPDGTDPKVVQATVKKVMGGGKPLSPTPPAENSNLTVGNLAGAALEPAVSMLTGAVAQPVSGIAGLLTPLARATGLTDKDAADVVREWQQALTYQPKTEGGKTAMEAFTYLPAKLHDLAVAAGERVQERGGSAEEATFIQTLIEGVPQLLGAKGLGKASAKASTGVPRIRKGAVSPEIRELANQGVTMTPGQRGNRMLNAMEQKLTSIPLAGDTVKGARGKSIEQWNRARLNDALKDASGKPLPENRTGRDALFHVEQEMKRRYGEVLGKMQGTLDTSLQTSLDALKQATPGAAEILDEQVIAKFKNGKVDGEGIKEIQDTLRTEANDHRRGNYQDRKIARSLDKARSEVSSMLKRENPHLAPELEAVDRGYAKFDTAALASRYGKKTGGIYTPAQALRAIERKDPSKGKRRFATGKAAGQPEAEMAERVLGNTVPDSGTAGRVLLADVLTHPHYLPPAILGSLAYSQPALKLLQRAALAKGIPGTAAATALPIGAIDQYGIAQSDQFRAPVGTGAEIFSQTAEGIGR